MLRKTSCESGSSTLQKTGSFSFAFTKFAAGSIFYSNDEPERRGTRRLGESSFFKFLILWKAAMGKWESCCWISTFRRGSRRGCGNVGIATAISKGWGRRRETCSWFSPLSTGRHFRSFFCFHAIFRSQILLKSFRFASCIAIAA